LPSLIVTKFAAYETIRAGGWSRSNSRGARLAKNSVRRLLHLSTVGAMRLMVPARDFELSKRFYLDIAFRPRG
jgi:hypothetical protein